MGQKVHPHGVRVGIIKDWSSKWYANSKDFSDYLIEDNKIAPYDNDLFLNLKDTVFDEDILQEVKNKADKLLHIWKLCSAWH